jgi:hypothetical protein
MAACSTWHANAGHRPKQDAADFEEPGAGIEDRTAVRPRCGGDRIRFHGRFQSKLAAETTKLGVRSSNLMGRAKFPALPARNRLSVGPSTQSSASIRLSAISIGMICFLRTPRVTWSLCKRFAVGTKWALGFLRHIGPAASKELRAKPRRPRQTLCNQG